MAQTYGIWGGHLRYLWEHHSGLLAGMQLTGQLATHLAEVDDILDRLTREIAVSGDVTAELKARNQTAWVVEDE